MGDRSVDLLSVGEKKYRRIRPHGKSISGKTLEKSGFYGKQCLRRKPHIRRDPSRGSP